MAGFLKNIADAKWFQNFIIVAILAAGSPHATAGEEMFLDHVHPTINGQR